MRQFLGILAAVTLLLVGRGHVIAQAPRRAQPSRFALISARPASFRVTPAALPSRFRSDSIARSSRRSAIIGAVTGAVVGGLGAAGYILNATAQNCVTAGPPCPKKNYIVLHTVTIAAGATIGGILGAKLGAWLGR